MTTTLQDIYEEFNAGDDGFCMAVESHCGFDITLEEIERIGRKAATAEEFQGIWQNEDWWTDEHNQA